MRKRVLAAKPDWTIAQAGALTLEEAVTYVDAFMERVYWQAYPVMLAHFSANVSDEGAQDILAGGSPGKEFRSRAFEKLMQPFMPAFRRELSGEVKAKPIPWLSKRAAEGIVQAVEKGYFNDPDLWNQVVGQYEGIVATAEG